MPPTNKHKEFNILPKCRAIDLSRQFTTISDDDITIIKHARRSVLFHNNHTDNIIDVTMGSFDGAEVSELVGLFILNSLQKLFGKTVSVYRNDGLPVLNTKFGRLRQRKKRSLTRTMYNCTN